MGADGVNALVDCAAEKNSPSSDPGAFHWPGVVVDVSLGGLAFQLKDLHLSGLDGFHDLSLLLGTDHYDLAEAIRLSGLSVSAGLSLKNAKNNKGEQINASLSATDLSFATASHLKINLATLENLTVGELTSGHACVASAISEASIKTFHLGLGAMTAQLGGLELNISSFVNSALDDLENLVLALDPFLEYLPDVMHELCANLSLTKVSTECLNACRSDSQPSGAWYLDSVLIMILVVFASHVEKNA